MTSECHRASLLFAFVIDGWRGAVTICSHRASWIAFHLQSDMGEADLLSVFGVCCSARPALPVRLAPGSATRY